LSVLPVGFGSAAGGTPAGAIERSLRFDGAASLTRTFGTPTSQTTWTMNLWFKRSTLSTSQYIFHSRDAGNLVSFECFLNSTDNLVVRDYNGSAYTANYVTTQVFRDPSAWYALTVRWDTTNATAANRCTIFINGVQITTFSTSSAPAQNTQSYWNVSGYLHSIGSFYNVASYYSGYITETTFVDGYVPTTTTRTVNGITETILTQLGEFSSSTGVWTPKAWDGTYSGNAAYLKFADNSNNTAATLGKDSSGLGNNWTPNGFSVTAGSGNDSLVDSPTQYGTDTGVGGEVRGNYCTLTPLLFRYAVGVGTITNGNLQATGSSTYFYSTFQMPATGKWYFEGVPTAGSSTPGIGLSDLETARTVFTSVVQYLNDGNKDVNGSQTSYGASYTTNDVIGVAVDCDAGTITFYKNNASQGAITTTVRNQFVFLQTGGSWTWVMNFGQRAFAYTAPSGFKALCTQNLPTPTIGATSTTQANKYMDVTLYTGNATARSITNGGSMQPDFVWDKLRSGSNSHRLFDAVRGVEKALYSNLTNVEATETGTLTAFNSNGFSLGTNNETNTNGSTYVAWQWKGNGAGSSNTAGNITSTVSANNDSGFSIVTGTLGAAGVQNTVGHGCKVGGIATAPSMILFKTRSGATYNWSVFHVSISTDTTKYLRLNDTSATLTYSTVWGAALPTSTVFGVTGDGCGSPSNPFVAYCFAPVAGYSAFGSYTGNGDPNGPFIYTGFKPRWLLLKSATGTAGDWILLDLARNPYNATVNRLLANTADTDAALSGGVDVNANGFKIRSSNLGYNGSTYTYIYAAFAESPFKYSLAR
jgi:hypothetical protein